MKKNIVPILSSVFMFVATFIVSGIFLSLFLPEAWCQKIISFVILKINFVLLVSLSMSTTAAAITFRSSFSAKTGKLYKKTEKEKNETPDP